MCPYALFSSPIFLAATYSHTFRGREVAATSPRPTAARRPSSARGDRLSRSFMPLCRRVPRRQCTLPPSRPNALTSRYSAAQGKETPAAAHSATLFTHASSRPLQLAGKPTRIGTRICHQAPTRKPVIISLLRISIRIRPFSATRCRSNPEPCPSPSARLPDALRIPPSLF